MQRGFAPIFIMICLLIFVVIIGVGYLGLQRKDKNLAKKEENSSANIQKVPPNKANENSYISAYDLIKKRGYVNPTPSASPKLTLVKSLESYGFTKQIDLKFVGVKALFPAGTQASLDGNTMYNLSVGDDHINVSLDDYDGGGRKAWFVKRYGAVDTFEPFYAKNHKGYIAFYKSQFNNKTSGIFYYFSATQHNKVLVVTGYNYIGGNYFFGGDMDKFKSFLSGIELIQAVDPSLYNVKTSDILKWSDTRKVIWEDYTLGLRITASEWVDYRNTNGRNIDGSYKFTDWSRSVPNANIYNLEDSKQISIPYGYYSDYLNIYTTKYQYQDFNDLVYDILLPAGFCSVEWKNSKTDCDSENVCYTRDDVIQNLRLLKEVSIGSMYAQLRSIDQGFNSKHDCRGQDTWVIKARDGHMVTTNIYPDGDIIKIENI